MRLLQKFLNLLSPVIKIIQESFLCCTLAIKCGKCVYIDLDDSFLFSHKYSTLLETKGTKEANKLLVYSNLTLHMSYRHGGQICWLVNESDLEMHWMEWISNSNDRTIYLSMIMMIHFFHIRCSDTIADYLPAFYFVTVYPYKFHKLHLVFHILRNSRSLFSYTIALLKQQ